MPPKGFLIVLGIAALVGGGWYWHCNVYLPSCAKLFSSTPTVESAYLCPWRDPERDLKAFFPGASVYKTETRVLSDARVELARKLGRLPTAEENALLVNQVFSGPDLVGYVLTRRVKGEYGAIEIVLATAPDGTVRNVRLQREREPEAISKEIENPQWLNGFAGQKIDSHWDTIENIGEISQSAKLSAHSIVQGVKDLLVLLDTSFQANTHLAHADHLNR